MLFRSILGLPGDLSQRIAAKEVLEKTLSVRATEALVKRLTAGKAEKPEPGRIDNDVHTRAAEEKMRFALGTRVRIVRRKTGGTIEIEFGSEAELNRIYEHITEQR